MFRFNYYYFGSIFTAIKYEVAQGNEQPKTDNLFRVDDDSIEKCFAANTVQCSQQNCLALWNLN